MRSAPLRFFSERPLLAAVLGAACIAFSAPFVRLSNASPTTVAVFRCTYALPVLGVLSSLERFRFGPRTTREHVLAVVAGIAFAADLITWHHSIEAVGAGLATVLGNLQVVVVGVIAWLVLKEPADRRVFAAIPVVVAGVVLVSGAVGAGAYGRDPTLGVIYGLLTSVAYSVFILVHREGARDLNRPAGPLFEATLVTTVVAMLFGVLTRDVDLTPVWPGHGWLIGLALSSQVVGWLLLSISLPRLPAAMSSVLLLLQPVGALMLGAAIFAEHPSPVQLGGVALILAGVILAAWGRSSRRADKKAAIPEPATP
ncbi:MAG: DMT family transporter [Actinomycetota bacterium]|nr:DMT family transporter [Actinomycetota bacterium]